MTAKGNIVKEIRLGNTRIKICDDYCRDRSRTEIDAILKRISKNALGPIQAVSKSV